MRQRRPTPTCFESGERLRQTAVRRKWPASTAPYLRSTNGGGDVRKARFNAMGAIINTRRRVEYETAYRHADGLYENQTDQETPGIIDDAPYGREAAGLNDRWSFRVGGDEAPTDNELFLESTATITKAVADGVQYTDVDEAIRANYKMKFVAERPNEAPPRAHHDGLPPFENRDDMKRISLMVKSERFRAPSRSSRGHRSPSMRQFKTTSQHTPPRTSTRRSSKLQAQRDPLSPF